MHSGLALSLTTTVLTYLLTYWAMVFKSISEVLGVTLRPCPLIAVFVIADETLGLNANQSDIIAFTMLLAHGRILLAWKSRSV